MEIRVFIKSKKNEYYSEGVYTNNGILVKKGSKIRKMTDSTFKRARAVLEIRNNEDYVSSSMILQKDVFFRSPSTAAQFVTDSIRNGFTSWKLESRKSLKTFVGGNDSE